MDTNVSIAKELFNLEMSNAKHLNILSDMTALFI